MNIRQVIFITIILSVIFSIGFVSASENVTDDELSSPADINVTFDEQMWEENLTDIDVEVPEDSSGDFCVKIDDEVIYNQTITEKSFKVPVKLPKRSHELVISIWPPIDYKYYKVSAFYNNIDLNITTPLKIMKNSPDYNMMHFPEEILQNDKYAPLLTFPRSANGTVEFYIDDRLFENTTARPTFYWDKNPFSSLPLGNHTFKVIYYGDKYYRPFNKTFEFLVTNVVIDIPEIINIGHDDCISVRTLQNVQGNVKVYIDGKLIANSNTDDGDYILSLEEFLKYTNREIKVVYTSKNFSRTKTKLLNMTYDFDVSFNSYIYGQDNILEIYLPDTLNNKLLKTTINGRECQFKRSTTVNNIVEIDVSKFKAGNYTLFISYPGDGKYYPLNKTFNFTIDYSSYIPFYFHYESDAKVYLKLPSDANGDLVVYVDGKYFGSKKFVNGYAEVKIGSIGLGNHEILAQYNGTDYNVSNQSERAYVSAKIIFDYQFTAGENKYITVKVPKANKGYVVFEINGKKHKVNVKDGIAKFSLKNLKAGEYEINMDYYGDDGLNDLYNWAYVTVKKAKFKVISAQATFKGVNVKIKLLTKKGKILAGKRVTVKFNGKTYKLKTNKKGILTLKKSMKLKNKKYTLKIYYMGAKLTKKLKVKAVDLKVKVGKSNVAFKVAINNKAQNKVVIKVGSKKYSIYTNKNGVKKLTVKKSILKNAKTVTCQARYLDDCVKYALQI